MTALQWLGAFQSRSQRGGPDGKPLCTYRCTTAEFEDLVVLLRGECAGRSRAAHMAHGVAPLFCLYAAEWWRRNYASGPWAWDPVLSQVELRDLASQELYYLVELGLKYWKRPLLLTGVGRGFLLTLACEGGLPLRLVHREGTKLRRYFRALLEEFQIFRGAEVPAAQLAERAGHYLPMSLRQAVVYSVSGQLVEAIWQLQQRLGTVQLTVDRLDRLEPGWRDRLPFVVEDATAEALLRNLVSDAAQVVGGASDRLQVERYLENADAVWQLVTTVSVPRTIAQLGLHSYLPGLAAMLPSRFELYLREAGGNERLLALGTAVHSGALAQYLLEQPSRSRVRLTGRAAADEVQLWVGVGEQRYGPLAARGTSGLTELPWVFVDRTGSGERLDFLGEGTVRSRHPVLFVARALGYTVAGEGGEFGVAGWIHDVGRELWSVSGIASFLDGEGNVCRVRSGQRDDRAAEYRLAGVPFPYGLGGERAFLGWPKCYEYGAGQGPKEVPAAAIEWRHPGQGQPWRTGVDTRDAFGEVELRVVSAGELGFRARATLLPPALRVRFVPGTTFRDGAFRFEGLGGAAIGWPSTPGLTMEREVPPAEGVFQVRACCESEPPMAVTAVLTWPGRGRAVLDLPFPARGGRFVTSSGRALVNHATVPLGRLGAVRALATSQTAADHFEISGSLQAADVPRELARSLCVFKSLRNEGGGQFGLSLGSLEERLRIVFSSSADIGALFALDLTGQTAAIRRLNIRRFDLAFHHDREASRIGLDATVRSDLEEILPERLAVEAYALWDPWREAIRLERDPAGTEFTAGWLVPADLEAGPWLVVGWDGDWCRVQPTAWNAGGASPAAAVEAEGIEPVVDVANLADAVRLRDARERQLVLDHLLEQLAADPTHPDWDGVLQYVQTFQGLPATTLDLMHRLTHHPRVIAALMFRADQSVLRALASLLEELPFSWHMMALDAWLEAASNLASALRRQLQGIDGNVDDLICGAFETFFSLAPQTYPHLALVAALVRDRVCACGRTSPALEEARWALAAARTPPGRDALLALLSDVQQDLMRAHADDTWPEGREVPEWGKRLRALPPALARLWISGDPGTGFRTAVLNAPVVAALSCVCGICPAPELTYEVRSLRAFDPRWFDEAHRLVLSLAVGS